MADVYATITEADPAVVEQLAEVLELRAADPQQQAMRDAYLDELGFPSGAHVLEVGCGTGALARAIARRPEVTAVVAADPSSIFLARGRELARDLDTLTFVEADARDLPVDAASLDVVVFHTSLSHIPAPDIALAETLRVLRPGGRLAIFDGDYATTTVAVKPSDPLQACADAAIARLVYDPYLVRRMPTLVVRSGFESVTLRGHSYVEAPQASEYMLTIVDRGAATLADEGVIGADAARALQKEARRRSEAGAFFGHIAYVSLLATKPAP